MLISPRKIYLEKERSRSTGLLHYGKSQGIKDHRYILLRSNNTTAMNAIIACGIFQKEIEALQSDLGFPFEVHYLEPGLHVNFDDLKAALQAELEKAQANGCEGIIVAFGQCHPKIDDILKPYHAVLIECQSCVDAFITRKVMEKKANKGLFFYLSPGWLNAWRNIFEQLGWGQTEARLSMGSFRGVVYMDTLKDASLREQELLEFFDFTNLPFEVMPVDLNHFKSLLLKAKRSLEG